MSPGTGKLAAAPASAQQQQQPTSQTDGAAPAAAEPEAPACEWVERVDSAKRRERTELKLHEWRRFGFADKRAADFAAIAAAPDNPPGCVARVHCSELSVEGFFEQFERKGLPVVIKGVPEAEGWPSWAVWTWQDLCRRFADVPFKVGKDDDGDAIKVRLGHFASYMQTQRDDSPLYVFDSSLGGSRNDIRPLILSEYRVPRYFPDDYMAVAGEDGRPPYRWLLIGPQRSGTPVHTDPLNTNAWNTLLRGRKRWALLPPGTARRVAKGRDVMRKDEDDEAINYFLDLVPRLRKEGHKVIEFVQEPGDTVFVPGNWWHSVLNLEDTVAITQNYCGRNNFREVWTCARSERPCWSRKWLTGMEKKIPHLAQRARELNEEADFDMEAVLRLNRERRVRRTCRRDWRALRSARRRQRRRSEGTFDEAVWWAERRRKRAQSPGDSSSSTVSTSSSETDSSSTSSSSSDSSRTSVSAKSAGPASPVPASDRHQSDVSPHRQAAFVVYPKASDE